MAYKLQQNVKRKERTTAEQANFTKLILLKIKGRTTFNQPEKEAKKRNRKTASMSGWGEKQEEESIRMCWVHTRRCVRFWRSVAVLFSASATQTAFEDKPHQGWLPF